MVVVSTNEEKQATTNARGRGESFWVGRGGRAAPRGGAPLQRVREENADARHQLPHRRRRALENVRLRAEHRRRRSAAAAGPLGPTFPPEQSASLPLSGAMSQGLSSACPPGTRLVGVRGGRPGPPVQGLHEGVEHLLHPVHPGGGRTAHESEPSAHKRASRERGGERPGGTAAAAAAPGAGWRGRASRARRGRPRGPARRGPGPPRGPPGGHGGSATGEDARVSGGAERSARGWWLSVGLWARGAAPAARRSCGRRPQRGA